MKEKILVLAAFLSVVFVLFFSGCIQEPVCGDDICQTGEANKDSPYYCPEDCRIEPRQCRKPNLCLTMEEIRKRDCKLLKEYFCEHTPEQPLYCADCCGNGECEKGEEGYCAEDCGIPTATATQIPTPE